MGDWNANTPSIRGLEWRPKSGRVLTRNSPNQGWALRFKSPGVVTLTHLHAYLNSVVGTPATAVEILDNLTPAQTATFYYPGTDVTNASWTRSTGAGTWFSHVDDNNDTSDYVTCSTNSAPIEFRGAASALSARRIGSITLYVYIKALGTKAQLFRLFLNIGGVKYYSQSFQALNNVYAPYTYTWRIDPVTTLPWTMTAINNIIQAAGTDEFGLVVDTNADVVLASMGITVVHCAENRKGYAYGSASWATGWKEFALTNTAALAANTYYYAHGYPITGDISNYVTVPLLKDANVVMATGVTATTGEHRLAYTTYPSDGGITIAAIPVTGELAPFLLDISGTIQSQSQPYAELDPVDVYNGAPVNFGQEITLPTGTTYGAVKITVGWGGTLRPDAPLKIEVRSGASAYTGGSTLHATTYLYPEDTPNGTYADYQVELDTPFSHGAATVTILYITSTASSTRPWRLVLLDTRSDVLTTTTAAEVQGASFGWQTGGSQDGTANSYFTAGTLDDRYEVPSALLSAPTAPAGFTATPAAAA